MATQPIPPANGGLWQILLKQMPWGTQAENTGKPEPLPNPPPHRETKSERYHTVHSTHTHQNLVQQELGTPRRKKKRMFESIVVPSSPSEVNHKPKVVNSPYLHSVILSLWDHVAGPKAEQIWTTNNPNNFLYPLETSKPTTNPHANPQNSNANTPEPLVSASNGMATPEQTSPRAMKPLDLGPIQSQTPTSDGSIVTLPRHESDDSIQLNSVNTPDTIDEPLIKSPLTGSPVLSRPSIHVAQMADKIARYTVGGGIVDIASMGNLFGGDQEPKLVDPWEIFSSKYDQDEDQYETTNLDIEYKIHTFEGEPYFTESALFVSPYNQCDTKFSLSFVIPKKYSKQYFLHHEVALDRLKQLCCMFVYYAQMTTTPITMIQKTTVVFMGHLNALMGCQGISPPDMKSTIFASELASRSSNVGSGKFDSQSDVNHFNELPPSVEVSEDTAQNEDVKRVKLREFLTNILTSHFQTHHRTVIIGDDVKSVNTYVQTIALFLLDGELKKVKLASADGKIEIIPDLLVQGVVGPAETILKQNRIQLIHSLYPTTIVDLPRRKIIQTCLTEQFAVVRADFQIHHYLCRKKILVVNENIWANMGSHFFVPVDKLSPTVYRILTRTMRIASLHAKMGFIQQSMQSLVCSALSLLKYIESVQPDILERSLSLPAELDKPKQPIPETKAEPVFGTVRDVGGLPEMNAQGQPPSTKSSQTEELINRIKYDLDIPTPSCFQCLLGIAEILRPGVNARLYKDSQRINKLQEKKWIELFGNL